MPKTKAKLLSRDKINRRKQRAARSGKAVLTLHVVPDFGPAERWQHTARTLFVGDEGGLVAARALEECMLDTLRVAGVIAPALYTAGMKLRRDYTRAALAPRQVGKYDGGGTGEKLLYREFVRSEGEEEAYQEWRAALLAAGIQRSDILVTVCCVGVPPTRANLPRLREGLERLYDHYQRLQLLAAQRRPTGVVR